VLWAGTARADVSTERPGSILIFPKVVCDGTRDTVVQVANTGNMTNTVRCFYLDGRRGGNGQPVCSETDFLLNLTRQQPTHWRACQGRRVDPTSPFGSEGAGLDPGLVPAVGLGFTGGLVCVEVGSDDLLPVGQSKLKGEATIEGFFANPVNAANESRYNAIAIPPVSVQKDNQLSLNAVEYSACPNVQILNYIPDGAPDPVIEDLGNGGLCGVGSTNPGSACNVNGPPCGGTGTCQGGLSSVSNRLTLIPCNLDFENARYSGVQLTFDARNEFEDLRSGSTTIPGCWGSFNLRDIPQLAFGGPGITTQYATLRITPSAPFLAVAESLHQDSKAHAATAATNLHTIGTANAIIRLSAP
jgi:hypothetical protein